MLSGAKRKLIVDHKNAPSSSEHSENGTPKRTKRNVTSWESWGVDSVEEYLSDCGIDLEAIGAFLEHDVRGRVLPYITEERLIEMGIEKVGVRLDVLRAMEPFQRTCISKSRDLEYKVFNDPIHDHIVLHPLCVAIIDTPQFQRLRDIKQLGGCYWVYPGATHKRFEHSIGVSHLAGQLLREIKSRQPDLNITDEDILCVEIAGLCHDMGHGPFSHLFDGNFIKQARPDCKWKHEDGSVTMFEHMVQVNNLKPKFEQYGLSEQDRTFIKEQIRGPLTDTKKEWKYKGRPKEKSFLYEIVANKRNGIDVDKWDYFARDCHGLGFSNTFNHNRFMKFARVITVGRESQICSRDKEISNVYDMFYTRYRLHSRAYQHKTCKVIEDMITEALLAADEHIKIKGTDGKMVRMSEAIDDPVAYTHLTDNVFFTILHSTSEELQAAREILERVQSRSLYKAVGQTNPAKGTSFSKKDRRSLAKEIVDDSGLRPDDICIQIVSLDFGMKTENPIDHVSFYKKDEPEKAIRIRKEEVSHILPESFHEELVRVFSKNTDDESLKTATIYFKRWCEKHDMKPSKSLDHFSNALTPVKLSQASSVGSQMSQNAD